MVATMLLATAFMSAAASAAVPSIETRHNEAGVRATDEHWGLAEQLGDTAYLGQMLLPEYQSVDTTKSAAHSKEEILQGAAKRTGTSLAVAKQKLDDYRKAHPYGTSVVMHGDIAVLNFYDLAKGAKNGVTSVDVFIYSGGRWRGFYSQ
jgi:hypothetical protein